MSEQRKRCAIIARVSKADQADEEHKSLEAQSRLARERAQREGLPIAREYLIPGESAWSSRLETRRIMNAIVADGEAGEFEVLIFHESSRLARNAIVDRQIRDRLEAAGVELIDLSNPVSRKTAMGKFMVGFQAQANEYWSDMISEHARKAYDERFARGLHCGTPPFGYTYGTTTNEPAVIVPVEAGAVVKGFTDYINGKGFTEIVQEWNRLGFKPRSKRGHESFTITGVQRVLGNDYYAGFVRHLGERRMGIHEPIIDEETWQRAQSRVQRRPKTSLGGGGLITGYATCAVCRGPIWTTSASGGRYRYYLDPARAQGRTCVDAGAVWRVDQVDPLIEEIMRSIAVGEDWLQRINEQACKEPRSTAEVSRASLLAERKRVTNAYLAGALEEREWRVRLSEVDTRLAAAPVPKSPTRVVFDRLRSFADLWEGAPIEVKRKACQIVFESAKADIGARTLTLKPWDEFAGLFELRRDFVGRVLPRGSKSSQQNTSGWFSPEELLGTGS